MFNKHYSVNIVTICLEKTAFEYNKWVRGILWHSFRVLLSHFPEWTKARIFGGAVIYLTSDVRRKMRHQILGTAYDCASGQMVLEECGNWARLFSLSVLEETSGISSKVLCAFTELATKYFCSKLFHWIRCFVSWNPISNIRSVVQ